MAYLVRITPRARRDLALLFDDIHAEDSAAALKWYKGLLAAAATLEELPDRCAVTPENPRLRHLLYDPKPHVYRIVFRVLNAEKKVNVLHIRHGARRRFSAANVR